MYVCIDEVITVGVRLVLTATGRLVGGGRRGWLFGRTTLKSNCDMSSGSVSTGSRFGTICARNALTCLSNELYSDKLLVLSRLATVLVLRWHLLGAPSPRSTRRLSSLHTCAQPHTATRSAKAR